MSPRQVSLKVQLIAKVPADRAITSFEAASTARQLLPYSACYPQTMARRRTMPLGV
jgi:hypothetical protein